MRKRVKKNMRVLKELLYLRFHGLVVFRLDFFGPFFVDGSLFFIQLFAFEAVYSNVTTIGGWGRGEMILYIGTFSLLNAVNMTIYFFGVNGIPDKVKSGELDLYLTKPVSPLFRLTFEHMSPGSVPLILMSVCMIVYGAGHLNANSEIVRVQEEAVRQFSDSRLVGALPAERIAAYVFWVLIMEILYYEMEVLMRSVSLYLVSMARMEQIEVAGTDLCMKLPGIAFYGIYKVIFYMILPYGIMATLPVQSLIGEMNWRLGIFGVSIVLVFSVLTVVVWKRGLKHYNSASS
ncbi:MAG: ABC-2 family transporter protein [Lachnospiraceae bacterium]|nr:ABC-2 family transporter protein [Lachnospiraceae bacterium]